MSKGKRHAAAADLYDRDHHHTGREALDLVKSFPGAKFDESVDVAIRLSVDPRKTEEMVRGTVALPSGTGKDVRVAVFAQGAAATAAREAGADHVGADDLAAEVEGGMTDFDVAIASPDMMPTVGKLGRVLGPRGLMPNPKTGTVTDDVAKAVEDFKGGKVEFRTDRYGNVHVPVGKVGFEVDAIYANLQAVVDELVRLKPSTAKGRYVKKVAVSSTMGPSVRIDPASIGGEPAVPAGGGRWWRHRAPLACPRQSNRSPKTSRLRPAQNESRPRQGTRTAGAGEPRNRSGPSCPSPVLGVRTRPAPAASGPEDQNQISSQISKEVSEHVERHRRPGREGRGRRRGS